MNEINEPMNYLYLNLYKLTNDESTNKLLQWMTQCINMLINNLMNNNNNNNKNNNNNNNNNLMKYLNEYGTFMNVMLWM